MNKEILVNLSSGTYRLGQDRLRDTFLSNNPNRIPAFYFDREEEVCAPNHEDNPYAFKVYSFDFALKCGFKNILWVDSSVYVINDISPIFKQINERGYIMQDSGFVVGNWANDKCLEYFGISRDEAMLMPMYGNAGLLGLNFGFEICKDFFNTWKKSMLDGMFKGAWNNDSKSESLDDRCLGHRHDMVCGSIIANKLGMSYVKADEILQYASPSDEVLNDTIILKAEGLRG